MPAASCRGEGFSSLWRDQYTVIWMGFQVKWGVEGPRCFSRSVPTFVQIGEEASYMEGREGLVFKLKEIMS